MEGIEILAERLVLFTVFSIYKTQNGKGDRKWLVGIRCICEWLGTQRHIEVNLLKG